MKKSEKILKLLGEGKSIAEIMKAAKCTKQLVYQVRKKTKVKGEPVELKTVFTMDKVPPFLQRKDDIINHPPHYKRNGIEAVDVIEAFELNYRLGNVVKYVLRHMNKGGVEDLKKAQWYLNREISKHE